MIPVLQCLCRISGIASCIREIRWEEERGDMRAIMWEGERSVKGGRDRVGEVYKGGAIEWERGDYNEKKINE